MARIAHRRQTPRATATPPGAFHDAGRLRCGEPTISIVDGDPATRQPLRASLGSLPWHVAAYGSADDFLSDEATGRRPGCLVVSTGPGVALALELLGRMAAMGLRIPVVVVARQSDVSMAVQAMRAGAINFMDASSLHAQLQGAIEEAVAYDAALRRQAVITGRIGQRFARLSPGEHEVLKRLLEGKSNKAMAEELGLSLRAIEVRRAKLMQKTQAESLAELVRLALALVQPAPTERRLAGSDAHRPVRPR